MFGNPTGEAWLLHDNSQVGTQFESIVNTLVEIKQGDGLWVNNTTDEDITVVIFGRTLTFRSGWQLVGV
ncbi:MAG: hypothetical protein IH991_12535 [Planctomycetes bacterium]|nr:hypothetical protein [Planctomycetota bacterium]